VPQRRAVDSSETHYSDIYEESKLMETSDFVMLKSWHAILEAFWVNAKIIPA